MRDGGNSDARRSGLTRALRLQDLAQKKGEAVGMLTTPWKREESQCREVDGEVERRRPVGGCGAVEDVLFRAS